LQAPSQRLCCATNRLRFRSRRRFCFGINKAGFAKRHRSNAPSRLLSASDLACFVCSLASALATPPLRYQSLAGLRAFGAAERGFPLRGSCHRRRLMRCFFSQAALPIVCGFARLRRGGKRLPLEGKLSPKATDEVFLFSGCAADRLRCAFGAAGKWILLWRIFLNLPEGRSERAPFARKKGCSFQRFYDTIFM